MSSNQNPSTQQVIRTPKGGAIFYKSHEPNAEELAAYYALKAQRDAEWADRCAKGAAAFWSEK